MYLVTWSVLVIRPRNEGEANKGTVRKTGTYRLPEMEKHVRGNRPLNGHQVTEIRILYGITAVPMSIVNFNM